MPKKQTFDETMAMLDQVLGENIAKELVHMEDDYTPEQFAAAELASERVHLVVRLAALDLKKVGLHCRVDFYIRKRPH